MTAAPFLPPSTIGIVGGGQLGMMTIREAQRMGFRTVVWDTNADCPASRLADVTIVGPYDDIDSAKQFASKVDVITYEFENINANVLDILQKAKPVRPNPDILRVSQNRRREKEELNRRGFSTVRFEHVSKSAGLAKAIESIGLPVVIKTATSGYDGKGQAVLHNEKDVRDFIQSLPGEHEYVVEEFVDLHCEISVIVARSASGEIITFPIGQNEHRENILHATIVPARIPASLQGEAEQLGRSVAASFDLVGVLCVEMFVTQEGKLIINELAPRPHNSGHYSLDACTLSQFEAQVRSVCGLPMTPTRLVSPCAMVNILGKHLEALDVKNLLEIEDTKLHLYGKTRNERNRKMGHITVLDSTIEGLADKVARIQRLIGEPASKENTLHELNTKE